MKPKAAADCLKSVVPTRFTTEQLAALDAARPPAEPLAAFVRRMASKGMAADGPSQPPTAADAALRQAAAFVVGVLSPDVSPAEALELYNRFSAELQEGE